MNNTRLLKLVSISSMILATLLFLYRLYVLNDTDSIGLLSLTLENGNDILASVIAFISLLISLKPSDTNHRFGHGKAEHLGTLFLSISIILSACFIFFKAITVPEQLTLHDSELLISTSIIALIFTSTLVFFQTYVIKHTNNSIIIADSIHYKTDILLNISFIISVFSSIYYSWIDVAFGFIISFYMIITGYSIFKESIDSLMDRELPDNIRSKILSIIIENHNENIHGFKTRKSGNIWYIQCHLEFEDISLQSAHEHSIAIKQKLLEHYPNIDVLFHLDPMDHKKIGHWRS